MILDSTPITYDPWELAGFEWSTTTQTYHGVFEEGTGFCVGIYVDIYCNHANVQLRWMDVKPGYMNSVVRYPRNGDIFELVRQEVLKMSDGLMDICRLKH